MRLLSLVAAGLALLGAASAQAPPVTQNGATSMTAVPTAATTRFVTVQVITSTLGQNSSSMASATSSTGSMSVVNATSTAAASTTAEAAVRLDTHIDPAFGILGALLILSGLAIAITGSAHKRLATFFAMAYAMAVATLALILHFGVEQQITQPRTGMRIAFLVAALAAGCIVGVGAVVFHREARAFIAPIAGFMFGLLLQSLRSNGLISQIGFRYFLFLGCTGIAFIMGLIPYMQEFIFLISTALLGSMAFVIGVDCFTTADLKEFLVYNLGFSAIFPRLEGHFAITSAMQIELGVILLVFFISVATQIRLYNMFETKLAVILKKAKKEEQADQEAKAAQRIAGVMEADVEKFEHRYSKGFPFASPPVTYSPRFGETSHGTPKSESAPLLPELAYTGAISKSPRPDEPLNRRLSAYVRSMVGGDHERQRLASNTPDSPRESASADVGSQPSEGLLKDILDKEKALEEIARLRERIGAERSSLRPTTASSASPSAESVTFPEAVLRSPVQATLVPHARSQSLTLDAIRPVAQLPNKRLSATSIARPVSQYSIITMQPPASPRSLDPSPSSLPMLQFDAPVQEPTSGLNYHNRTRSQGALMGRSPSNNTISGMGGPKAGPQRIITGALPSRPSSQSLQSIPVARTQTMDIAELQARHRRKLSQLQSGSRNSLVTLAGEAPAAGPAATTGPAPNSSHRKRSSSTAGLNTIDSTRGLSQGPRTSTVVNEFGQIQSLPVGGGSKRSSRRQSMPRPATGLSMPIIIQPAPALQSATVPAKTGPNDWLAY